MSKPKVPKDINLLAKMIVDKATGEKKSRSGPPRSDNTVKIETKKKK